MVLEVEVVCQPCGVFRFVFCLFVCCFPAEYCSVLAILPSTWWQQRVKRIREKMIVEKTIEPERK